MSAIMPEIMVSNGINVKLFNRACAFRNLF
jgi:hypothetical protein